MQILYVATKNNHKLTEIRDILKDVPYDILLFPNMPDIEETGNTFEENASIKAVELSLLTDEIVIADDSGLSVDALKGEPGIYSARYAGNKGDEANNIKLLSNMKDEKNRKARFICVISLAKKGKVLKLFRGKVEGDIAYSPCGNGGFGYDPIFLLPNGKSMAQLLPEEKNNISHRKKALEQLKNYLINQ